MEQIDDKCELPILKESLFDLVSSYSKENALLLLLYGCNRVWLFAKIQKKSVFLAKENK